MREKVSLKIVLNIALSGIILFGLFLFALFKPADDISISERRPLKQMPKLSVESVFGNKTSSSFMDDFESYAKDQFPLRERFRELNALAGRYVFGRKEINDLYVADGHIGKIEDGLHTDDLEWSASRIEYIMNKYIDDQDVYMAIIPDKNYYLGADMGYPYVDVTELSAFFEDRFKGNISFIDLSDKLRIEDYYRTDTHWKQEKIIDVADYLLSKLVANKEVQAEGIEAISGDDSSKTLAEQNSGKYDGFKINDLDFDYYGVYYGQAAMPMAPDKISYLTWDGMDELIVNCYDTGSPVEMGIYDFEKAKGLDPYELFLSGSKALITIENPKVDKKELVLFRDSFGSGLAPILSVGYSKITLVDIRYLNPAMLDRFIDFEGADVMFLYSSNLLNNSIGQFN